MVPHSRNLAWKTPGWRSLEGCSPWGRWGMDTTERLHFHFSLSCIGEWNGNLLQCSFLENPRDVRAWWAAVYGVTQSRTRLKQFSSNSSSFPLCPFSVQFSRSVVSNSLRPMNHSTPGLPVHHQLPEFTQTHVRWVGDAIQPLFLLRNHLFVCLFWFCFLFEYLKSPLLFCVWSGKRLNLPTNWCFLSE